MFKPGESHRLGNLAKVLAFIWNFDRINRPRIEAGQDAYGPNVPVERLNGDRDIADFLSSYGEGRSGEVQAEANGFSVVSSLFKTLLLFLPA